MGRSFTSKENFSHRLKRNDKKANPVYLFNVEQDPSERNNVAAQNADVVKKLQDKIAKYANNMVPPFDDTVDPDAEQLIRKAGHWYSWQGD